MPETGKLKEVSAEEMLEILNRTGTVRATAHELGVSRTAIDWFCAHKDIERVTMWVHRCQHDWRYSSPGVLLCVKCTALHAKNCPPARSEVTIHIPSVA